LSESAKLVMELFQVVIDEQTPSAHSVAAVVSLELSLDPPQPAASSATPAMHAATRARLDIGASLGDRREPCAEKCAFGEEAA
jgi:hypothetical protein